MCLEAPSKYLCQTAGLFRLRVARILRGVKHDGGIDIKSLSWPMFLRGCSKPSVHPILSKWSCQCPQETCSIPLRIIFCALHKRLHFMWDDKRDELGGDYSALRLMGPDTPVVSEAYGSNLMVGMIMAVYLPCGILHLLLYYSHKSTSKWVFRH